MISVMYAGNDRMFDGILISAMSSARHTAESFDVYLLTMDLTDSDPDYRPISEEQRAFIEEIYRSANADSHVSIIDVGDLYRDSLFNSPNSQTDYTPYCFLRLFADRLPTLPEKVLYLDADTIVNGDLSPLFHTDIGGCEYGAVLDYYGRWFMGYRYVNSGVMLLNMTELRRTGLLRRAVELCAERRLFLPDQTALHRLTTKKYLLPAEYNEQKHYDRDGTVIQHFTKTILWLPYFHTRNIKPWQTELVSEVLTDRYDDLLCEYLAKKREYEEISYDKKSNAR